MKTIYRHYFLSSNSRRIARCDVRYLMDNVMKLFYRSNSPSVQLKDVKTIYHFDENILKIERNFDSESLSLRALHENREVSFEHFSIEFMQRFGFTQVFSNGQWPSYPIDLNGIDDCGQQIINNNNIRATVDDCNFSPFSFCNVRNGYKFSSTINVVQLCRFISLKKHRVILFALQRSAKCC